MTPTTSAQLQQLYQKMAAFVGRDRYLAFHHRVAGGSTSKQIAYRGAKFAISFYVTRLISIIVLILASKQLRFLPRDTLVYYGPTANNQAVLRKLFDVIDMPSWGHPDHKGQTPSFRWRLLFVVTQIRAIHHAAKLMAPYLAGSGCTQMPKTERHFMRVLVTGGAGYIGSHTLLELLAQGHDVMVLDDYSNASPEVLPRVRALSNHPVPDVHGDVRDGATLDAVMVDFAPDAVIHFAGLKAVGQSMAQPLRYYDVNVAGTLALLAAMDRAGARNIIFSSSATVYGEPAYQPYDEAHPLQPTSVYGRSKLMAEQVRPAGHRTVRSLELITL